MLSVWFLSERFLEKEGAKEPFKDSKGFREFVQKNLKERKLFTGPEQLRKVAPPK